MKAKTTPLTLLDKVAAKDISAKIVDRTEDMFTTQEYADHVGIALRTAHTRLKNMELDGKVVKVVFAITNAAPGKPRSGQGWQLVETK